VYVTPTKGKQHFLALHVELHEIIKCELVEALPTKLAAVTGK